MPTRCEASEGASAARTAMAAVSFVDDCPKADSCTGANGTMRTMGRSVMGRTAGLSIRTEEKPRRATADLLNRNSDETTRGLSRNLGTAWNRGDEARVALGYSDDCTARRAWSQDFLLGVVLSRFFWCYRWHYAVEHPGHEKVHLHDIMAESPLGKRFFPGK